MPVSIWIHGGAFRWGQGGSILYDGRVVAGQADHIIITLNYRLSAFGFFYKGFIESDQTNDGNWGFLDQQMAIKWVKENIAGFNGDPDRITVYGESAGAISSIQHVINKESRKHFNSAIIQSNPLAIPFKEAWEATIQGTESLQIFNLSSYKETFLPRRLDVPHLTWHVCGRNQREI